MKAKTSPFALRSSRCTPTLPASLSGRGLLLPASALLTLLFWSAAPPAHAQLTLTLPTDPIDIDRNTGGTAIFHATLTNNYAFDLFLNSDSFTVSSPATLDDTLFQNYFVTPSGGMQPTLAANGGTLSLDLFSVHLSAGTPAGIYGGILTLQGGATPLDADDLVTGEFAVRAAATSVAVPETNGVAILVSLLGASGSILYRRRVTNMARR
jgi:hypothetical protein